MIRREVQIGDCRLLLGDALEILPTLGPVDAVVTDPPYGILNLDGEGSTTAVRKYKRSNHGRFAGRAVVMPAKWDTAPTDEAFGLIRSAAPHQIIWGGNYFNLPPCRGFLVWDKEQPWPNFAQAEIAWTTLQRPAALFRISSSRGAPNKQHPTQKPVALMQWCLGFLPDAKVILDPYLGSGTTAVACAKMGRSFVGIEIDEGYFDIACKRIRDAYAQPDFFTAPPVAPKQEAMEL